MQLASDDVFTSVSDCNSNIYSQRFIWTLVYNVVEMEAEKGSNAVTRCVRPVRHPRGAKDQSREWSPYRAELPFSSTFIQFYGPLFCRFILTFDTVEILSHCRWSMTSSWVFMSFSRLSFAYRRLRMLIFCQSTSNYRLNRTDAKRYNFLDNLSGIRQVSKHFARQAPQYLPESVHASANRDNDDRGKEKKNELGTRLRSELTREEARCTPGIPWARMPKTRRHSSGHLYAKWWEKTNTRSGQTAAFIAKYSM